MRKSSSKSSTRDVYLSVDLDYWTCVLPKSTPARSIRRAGAFLARVGDLGRPIRVEVMHELLLDDLTRAAKQYSHLINVDFHDDIETKGRIQVQANPTDGDWVAWVPWREDATYEWRYPSRYRCLRMREGYCSDGDRYFWEHPGLVSDWGRCIRKEGVRGIPWQRVDRVFIAISPEYTSFEPVIRPLARLVMYPHVTTSDAAKIEIAARMDWIKL